MYNHAQEYLSLQRKIYCALCKINYIYKGSVYWKNINRGALKLTGEVSISGAKNAAVAILPKQFWQDQPVLLNLPMVRMLLTETCFTNGRQIYT